VNEPFEGQREREGMLNVLIRAILVNSTTKNRQVEEQNLIPL
jgi:hypothetical protein